MLGNLIHIHVFYVVNLYMCFVEHDAIDFK